MLKHLSPSFLHNLSLLFLVLSTRDAEENFMINSFVKEHLRTMKSMTDFFLSLSQRTSLANPKSLQSLIGSESWLKIFYSCIGTRPDFRRDKSQSSNSSLIFCSVLICLRLQKSILVCLTNPEVTAEGGGRQRLIL